MPTPNSIAHFNPGHALAFGPVNQHSCVPTSMLEDSAWDTIPAPQTPPIYPPPLYGAISVDSAWEGSDRRRDGVTVGYPVLVSTSCTVHSRRLSHLTIQCYSEQMPFVVMPTLDVNGQPYVYMRPSLRTCFLALIPDHNTYLFTYSDRL